MLALVMIKFQAIEINNGLNMRQAFDALIQPWWPLGNVLAPPPEQATIFAEFSWQS